MRCLLGHAYGPIEKGYQTCKRCGKLKAFDSWENLMGFLRTDCIGEGSSEHPPLKSEYTWTDSNRRVRLNCRAYQMDTDDPGSVPKKVDKRIKQELGV